MFSYLPHQSKNPYELLAIAILRQAYMDIFDYYKRGTPTDHDGVEAIDWLKNGNGTLTAVIQTIQLVQERRGWDFGGTEESIHKNLIRRIKSFKAVAEGKDEKAKKEIQKAWQLMSI
ncbi:MAG: hypothetical protein [Podoviridae sp. ctg2L5]|nr:MAG: hypothetical protein [Podoviridae sp. ctg2L5]